MRASMLHPFPPDLQTLVREQMASGKYASEDELLRSALRALAEEEQDLDAVRESLAELRAGDPGVPLEDAFGASAANTGSATRDYVSRDPLTACDPGPGRGLRVGCSQGSFHRPLAGSMASSRPCSDWTRIHNTAPVPGSTAKWMLSFARPSSARRQTSPASSS